MLPISAFPAKHGNFTISNYKLAMQSSLFYVIGNLVVHRSLALFGVQFFQSSIKTVGEEEGNGSPNPAPLVSVLCNN